MKQIKILLAVILLWLGGTSAVWANYEYYTDQQTGVTYVFDTASPDHYAWISSIVTEAEELTINDNFMYGGNGYQVVGFDRQFESGVCPNLKTIHIKSLLTATNSFNDIGYVQGNFSSLTKLTELYFDWNVWKLNDGRTTFPSGVKFSVYTQGYDDSWQSCSHYNYYVLPEFWNNHVGYYLMQAPGYSSNVAAVTNITTDYVTDRHLVIPATVTKGASNPYTVYSLGVSYFVDIYYGDITKNFVETLEVEGDIRILNLDLTEFSKLETITFDGAVNLESNHIDMGAPNLKEVIFKGEVTGFADQFWSAKRLRKICFFGQLPEFRITDEPFFDKTGITIYANMTAEEIRTLKRTHRFWESVDLRPLDASPEGGIIVGSVKEWVDQLVPEQHLDFTTLRPIGMQTADDMAAIKSLCNGTLASVQTLDMREMTLAEGLQLSLAGFSSLTTVYLPMAATPLANDCFSGCNAGLVVNVSSATVPTTASTTAFGTDGSDVQGMTLIVPSGTLNTYRTLEPWKHFGTIIATTATGDASLTLFAGISNGVVELWKGSTKVGSISKKGGLLTETVQMPADLQLRVPSQYLDKVKINGIDVTSVLPSVASTEAPYEDYTFFTVDDLTPVTFVEVAFEDNIPQRYETSSLGFLLRGDGTVEGKITTPDGVRNIELTDGVLRYEQWGTNDDPVMKEIESLVLTVKPQGSSNIQFNCGNSTYTSVDNNDGSYTYTILGENMHSSFFTIDLMEAGGDVKTIITSRDNIELGYYFGLYVGDEGITEHTIQQESSLQNNSATVMHSGVEDPNPFGFFAETSLGIVYVQVPQGTTFRLVEDGVDWTSDCVWYNEGQEMDVLIDYDDEGEINNKWSFLCPAAGYYYRQKNIQTDSYIIVDNGEGPVVSPYQIPLTLSCYGDGVISLRNEQGEEVKTVSDGEQKTVSVEKGNTMTLVVTAPEGVNLANYEALLFIDGVVRVLEKTDAANGATTFEPFTLENIVAPCNIVLSMKQTGGFNNPDIIAFADPNVEAICVENWDTDHDGKLSKTEAAAVTTLKKDGTSVFYMKGADVTSFDELQYFTNLTTIEKNVFFKDSIRSLILPPSITTIEESGLAYTRLRKVDLPEGVTTIGHRAFSGSYNIEEIRLPQSLTNIGYFAFSDTRIKHIFIPKNVNVISFGGNLFADCKQLTDIAVDENNATYSSRDNCSAIIEKSSSGDILCYGCKNTTIPNGITEIWTQAFGYLGLKKMVIPESVSNIRSGAFISSALESLEFKRKEPIQFDKNIFNPSSTDIPLKETANCVLTVPFGTIEAYNKAGWKTIADGGYFKEIVEAPLNTDVNGDGQVSISDAVIIVDEILNK